MNFNKKTALITGAVAVVLVGGGTGIYYAQQSAAHQHQVDVQRAKQKVETDAQANATQLLLAAEKDDSQKNVTAADLAVRKITDVKVAKKDTDELIGIKNRVVLENQAQTAVTAYSKDVANATKQKAAKTIVAKLTSPYSKALKDKLNKEIAAADKAGANKPKASTPAKASATPAASNATPASTTTDSQASNNASAGSTDSTNSASSATSSGDNSYQAPAQQASQAPAQQAPQAPQQPQAPQPQAPAQQTPPAQQVSSTWTAMASDGTIIGSSYPSQAAATAAGNSWLPSQHNAASFVVWEN
jgi:sensor c-di-GMP phosphodiesterase-like protein